MLNLFKNIYLRCKRRNILKRSIIICKIVRGELPEWKIQAYYKDSDFGWTSRWRIYDMMYHYKFKDYFKKRNRL